MSEVPEGKRHETRCLRWREIDWDAPIISDSDLFVTEPGDVVLKVENLQKYYQVSANSLFGGKKERVVKANEEISFEAREGETVALVGESGCGKSTLAKVLMGLETATQGQIR